MAIYYYKLKKQDEGYILLETGDKINLEDNYSIYQAEPLATNAFSKEILATNTFNKEPLQTNTFTKEPLANS